jgi:hypothetical protein
VYIHRVLVFGSNLWSCGIIVDLEEPKDKCLSVQARGLNVGIMNEGRALELNLDNVSLDIGNVAISCEKGDRPVRKMKFL